MSLPVYQAPVVKAGAARGRANPTINELHKIGKFEWVAHISLESGDIVASGTSVLCVIKVDQVSFTLRDVDTSSVKVIRVNPYSTVARLRLRNPLEWCDWSPSMGDVVVYPQGPVVLVRNLRGWSGTEAPWMLRTDAEMLLGVREGRVRLLRTRQPRAIPQIPDEFPIGAIAASGDWGDRDPMVLRRQEPDYWVTSIRGVILSDTMVRNELERGVYHLLRLPKEAS